MGGMMRGNWVLAMAVCTWVAGCNTLQQDHGYVPVASDLDRIEVGVDTRDTVAAIVGRPSTEGVLAESAWYYVQSRWATRGASAPREAVREVVEISFDKAGRVSNVARFGLEQGQIITLSRRVTEPNVKGATIIGQLFGNIGRVNTDRLLSR
jgi:outer membrane protein assembly factor BamE (lipoprotein component of BamABCDE complex)